VVVLDMQLSPGKVLEVASKARDAARQALLTTSPCACSCQANTGVDKPPRQADVIEWCLVHRCPVRGRHPGYVLMVHWRHQWRRDWRQRPIDNVPFAPPCVTNRITALTGSKGKMYTKTM